MIQIREKIDFKHWIILGALFGAVVYALAWVLSLMGISIPGTTIDMTGFFMALILGAIYLTVGRFALKYTKHMKIKGFDTEGKIWQAALIGYVLVSLLMTIVTSGMPNWMNWFLQIFYFAIVGFVASWTTVYLSKHLKIKVPV